MRVLIDGVQYDEVSGLNEAKLNIARDNNVKGLLIKFISDVTFYGAAYTAILDYVEANDDCSQIPIDIYFGSDNGDGLGFQGYIVYKDPDTKIDKTNCRLTTKIQQGDLSGFILDKLNYQMTINAPVCIDGTTALTPITDRETQYFTNGGGLTFLGGFQTYLVKDVLTQLLEFLSNGTIGLNAPIFDVKQDQDYYQIEFNGWTSGETMTLEWTNFYGQTWQAQQLFATSASTSITRLEARCLHEHNNNQIQADRTQYLQKWSASDTDLIALTMDLYSHLPFTDVSISVSPSRGGVNEPTVTKLNAFAFGLQGLAIVRESYLMNVDGQFRVSLGQLLRHLTQVFNLSFSFQRDTSGNLEMLLQPLEDYFDNTQAIDLGNIRQVNSEFSDDFAINQLNTPSGVGANIFTATTWSTDVCIGAEIGLQADGFSSQDFYNAFVRAGGGPDAADVGEKLLWAMTDIDNSYNTAIRYAYHVIDNSGFPSTIITSFRYTYNTPYISALRCYNYFINSNKDFTQPLKDPDYILATCLTNCDNGIITNTNTLLIDTLYKFEGRLTQDQIKTLRDNTTQFIIFAINGVEYKGFINEIEIDLLTKQAQIELLAENIL